MVVGKKLPNDGQSSNLIGEVCERSAAMRISTEVDRATIVRTPSYRHMLRIIALLNNDPSRQERGVITRITIQTAASEAPVQGNLYICYLARKSATNYYYSGIFQGQLVEGNLDPSPGGTGDMQSL